MITQTMRGEISELAGPTTKLIGRRDTKNELTRYLCSGETCVVGIHARGGAGKTVLVRSWLDDLASLAPDANLLVAAWQFPEATKGCGSSESFFNVVLPKLGSAPGSYDLQAEAAKAKQLELALTQARRPVILVLDRFEALQDFEGETPGLIKDEAFKQFLTKMTTDYTRGNEDLLVVVTTREALAEPNLGSGFAPLPLRPLTPREGAELLEELGMIDSENVDPDQKVKPGLENASRYYQGNPLSLVLLAGIIREVFETNDISKRYDIRKFVREQRRQEGGADRQGPGAGSASSSGRCEVGCGAGPDDGDVDRAHAKELVEYYVRKANHPEDGILLQLMALVHRPLEIAERRVLLEKATIAASVRNESDEFWDACHRRLEKVRLLERAGDQGVWDCHPLVREYFREASEEGGAETRKAWCQAHEVLFEHFKGLPVPQQIESIDDLLPLYRAIHHGCLAGRFADAYRIYRFQVMQGSATAFGGSPDGGEGGAGKANRRPSERARATNEFGAVSQDSAALSMFFISGGVLYRGCTQQLTPDEQAWLQARRGFCLTCLGRLREAMGHRQAELRHCLTKVRSGGLAGDAYREAERNTANAAAMLCQLRLLDGKLRKAEAWGLLAVKHARGAEPSDQLIRCLCRLGAVMHMRGNMEGARLRFDEARREQAERNKRTQHLSSDHGFLFRRFWVDELEERGDRNWQHHLLHDAEAALQQDENDENTWLVAIALGHLAKASAMARKARVSRRDDDRASAGKVFDEAKEKLRYSGSVIDLPLFMLERGRFRCWCKGSADRVEKDVEKGLRFAKDYRMPLYQADAHLLWAELLTQPESAGNPAKVALHIDAARQLVKQCGYGRATGRLARLEQWQAAPDFDKPRVECD